ncbi:spore maturation protein [Treponema sp. R6D11]
MQILNYISKLTLPIIILLIIVHGIYKKVSVFTAFIDGAKEGAANLVKIVPALIAIFVAIAMFKESGLLYNIVKLISYVLKPIGFPPEVLPLAIIRPISGSGALGITGDLINTHGANSYIGRVVSVMMGSTETTFYTIAVYFGAVKVRDIRWTLWAALAADLTGIFASVYIVRMFWGH